MKTWLACGFAALVLTGCGTIINGSHQKVPILSNPTGATVVIDEKSEGATPIVATLMRDKNHFVKITLAGYEPVEVSLHSEISGWAFGSVLFGLIGIFVDWGTGGAYKLTPEQLDIELKQQKVNFRQERDALFVGVTLHPEPARQQIARPRRSAQ